MTFCAYNEDVGGVRLRNKEKEKEINKERRKKEMCHITWPPVDLGYRLNSCIYCVKNLLVIRREHNRSQLKNIGQEKNNNCLLLESFGACK